MAGRKDSDHLPLSEGWIEYCGECLKPISAARPPILNPDNCSCAEKAAICNGHGRDHSSPYTSNTVYHQTTDTPLFQVPPLDYNVGHVPPSFTSSHPNEVVGQDGIEQYAPDLTINSYGVAPSQQQQTPGNSYLPLNSGTTDSERFARRSFYFHSNLNFAMQNYLNAPEEPYAHTFHSSEDESPLEQHYTFRGGFLDQGMQFGNESMLVAAQTSRRSKLSYKSSAEHSSALLERSWHVFDNLDGTLHAGGWVDRDEDVYENGYEYQLHVSGMTDYEE